MSFPSPLTMNNRNGKEIIQEPQSPSSHSARNDIMRPFKLQKLQTPILETTLQFHEHISYHGESSSNGGHTDHSGPCEIVIQRADSSILNYRQALLADPDRPDGFPRSSKQHKPRVPLGNWSGREK